MVPQYCDRNLKDQYAVVQYALQYIAAVMFWIDTAALKQHLSDQPLSEDRSNNDLSVWDQQFICECAGIGRQTLEICWQMLNCTAVFWIVDMAFSCGPIVEHLCWRMVIYFWRKWFKWMPWHQCVQDCGERHWLFDKRLRGQKNVGLLWTQCGR